ncbi:unnamed protein product [Allacma fusca]|uniref:Uncharacterized protein n=1 Tax=Allacma fusca TaxID=39272 RepID=A0A8J2PUP7_9HEXA|nr:unnamed protein product [Allacma fusca]
MKGKREKREAGVAALIPSTQEHLSYVESKPKAPSSPLAIPSSNPTVSAGSTFSSSSPLGTNSNPLSTPAHSHLSNATQQCMPAAAPIPTGKKREDRTLGFGNPGSSWNLCEGGIIRNSVFFGGSECFVITNALLFSSCKSTGHRYWAFVSKSFGCNFD